MERDEIREVLAALAEGLDPLTGEALPASSPCHHPRVVRALYSALQLINPTPATSAALVEAQGIGEGRPANAGKPWDQAEDDWLARDFISGGSLGELAGRHGRTTGAIESRLCRLGLLELPADRQARATAGTARTAGARATQDPGLTGPAPKSQPTGSAPLRSPGTAKPGPAAPRRGPSEDTAGRGMHDRDTT